MTAQLDTIRKHIIDYHTGDNGLTLDQTAEALREALIAGIPDLEFEERRNNTWTEKQSGDYQVVWCKDDIWRVRRAGRLLCREIKGRHRAINWANAHNRDRIAREAGLL